MPRPPERSLGDNLIRIIRLMHAARHQALRQVADVDPMHYPLMFRIWSHPCRVSDLAGALHADISTISRQVSTLTEQRLVVKLPDASDRRAQVLALTDAGKDLLLDVRARRDSWLEALMGDWTAQDRAQFARLLARFATDLERGLEPPPSMPSA